MYTSDVDNQLLVLKEIREFTSENAATLRIKFWNKKLICKKFLSKLSVELIKGGNDEIDDEDDIFDFIKKHEQILEVKQLVV